jgi:hypothetical protein
LGIALYKEPELHEPDMIVGWPGIANIGIIAVDTLRVTLKATEFGEIEPWDFFYPEKVVIRAGMLEDLVFPINRFYYRKSGKRDLIFFIGEKQPGESRAGYATGRKAYEMANLVLDVAEKFGCHRVYTSGAAVALIHHTMRPRVWAVPNNEDLIAEINRYENTVLMSGIEGIGSQGTITGLNGLLLGMAKNRGLTAMCLMGEIPYYLQTFPWPYPKASKSVLETLSKIIGLELDLRRLDDLAKKTEDQIERFLQRFYQVAPPEISDGIKKGIESLKQAKPEEPGPITKEEQDWIKEHIDEFFRKGKPL